MKFELSNHRYGYIKMKHDAEYSMFNVIIISGRKQGKRIRIAR